MTEIREMNYRCQTVVCTGVKEVVELDNLEDFPWHGGKSKRKRFSITILQLLFFQIIREHFEQNPFSPIV